MKNKQFFLIYPAILFGLWVLIGTLSAEDTHPAIKVMSFNIRYGTAKDGDNSWEHRKRLVLETIRVFDPDLLGLQEVQKFQAEFLKENLPDYAFHGVGRNDGKEGGEFVPVMFKQDRFQLINSGHFWLSDTPEIPGSKAWDAALPRMASWVHLSDTQAANIEFGFGNTHFDHRGVNARLQSAKLIRTRVNEISPEVEIIIIGDFNTLEELKPYATLVKAEHSPGIPLIDTYRAIHPEKRDREGTFNAFTGERERNRIDWILHTQHFVTLNAAINYTNDNGRYPSDHYPVEAVVRLK